VKTSGCPNTSLPDSPPAPPEAEERGALRAAPESRSVLTDAQESEV
jgi:hypothetical protein